jgi:hypothetical protein
MMNPEQAANYTRTIESDLGPFLKALFVPLLRHDEEHGTFRPQGSGFLLRLADLHFLITAKHVLDDFLVLPGRPPPTSLQTLWAVNHSTGKQFSILGKSLTADPYDLGMVELRQEVVEQFKGFRFLTLSEIRPAPAQGIFIVCGFPEELQSRSVSSAFVYVTHAYEGAQGGLTFDRKTDLPLVWDQSFSVSPEGSPVGMPDRLKGVSGGPTFLLDNAPQPSIENLRLVGIETATQRIDAHRHLIKVVRIEEVLMRLLRSYPDLLRVLELHRIEVR